MSKIIVNRKVLEQALEALVWEAGPEPALYDAQTLSAVEALRAELEQAELEQEPVAWRVSLPDGYQFVYDGRFLPIIDERIHETGQPLYTHPPRREWQGLTEEEEEIKTAVRASEDFWATYAQWTEYVARAAEAALKEKNRG